MWGKPLRLSPLWENPPSATGHVGFNTFSGTTVVYIYTSVKCVHKRIIQSANIGSVSQWQEKMADVELNVDDLIERLLEGTWLKKGSPVK